MMIPKCRLLTLIFSCLCFKKSLLIKNLFINKNIKFYYIMCPENSHYMTTHRLVEVGAQDVQRLPLFAQPAPRESYAPMAGKPAPSSHEPPRQWNQAPVTLIYQWKNKGGEGWGKWMIQRLNEESGHQESVVLSTWRWCKKGWLRLSQTTYRWPRSRSLLLTVLNEFNFI